MLKLVFPHEVHSLTSVTRTGALMPSRGPWVNLRQPTASQPNGLTLHDERHGQLKNTTPPLNVLSWAKCCLTEWPLETKQRERERERERQSFARFTARRRLHCRFSQLHATLHSYALNPLKILFSSTTMDRGQSVWVITLHHLQLKGS